MENKVSIYQYIKWKARIKDYGARSRQGHMHKSNPWYVYKIVFTYKSESQLEYDLPQ